MSKLSVDERHAREGIIDSLLPDEISCMECEVDHEIDGGFSLIMQEADFESLAEIKRIIGCKQIKVWSYRTDYVMVAVDGVDWAKLAQPKA